MSKFPQPTHQELGQAAYNAYRDFTGGLTWNNYPMPMWADLPPHVQGAWAAAGHHMREATISEVVQWLSAEGVVVP